MNEPTESPNEADSPDKFEKSSFNEKLDTSTTTLNLKTDSDADSDNDLVRMLEIKDELLEMEEDRMDRLLNEILERELKKVIDEEYRKKELEKEEPADILSEKGAETEAYYNRYKDVSLDYIPTVSLLKDESILNDNSLILHEYGLGNGIEELSSLRQSHTSVGRAWPIADIGVEIISDFQDFEAAVEDAVEEAK